MASNNLKNKRQRIDDSSEHTPSSIRTHSRILAPYRSLGHITSPNTPFSCIPRGSATFQVTTSVGTTLQTYDVRHLNLVFVSSPATPAEIRRVFAWKEYIFAAFGGAIADVASGVWMFRRGKKTGELEEPMGGWHRGGWKEFMIFGDWIIGAFANGDLVVWKAASREVHTEIPATRYGEIAGVVHPNTYLNKIVVARTSGELEIWNVKTGKLVYTCESPLLGTTVTAITNTTHLHHVAIATNTAQIHIHNILLDTPLFTLGPKVASTKRITSLTFCTDPTVGAGTSPEGKVDAGGSARILAAGDDEGDITLWDLEKRRIVGMMRSAHSDAGGIVKCEFLAAQKVMITTGGDNSLKEWIFDSPHTVLPRILRHRSGHSAPPTTLTFHNPAESHFLISSSQDRTVWGVSLRNDAQSFELSQGSGGVSRKVKKLNLKENIQETKAPPVTAIAVSDSEGAKRDWENILTAHRGETAARTWHYEMKRLGRWVFPTSDGGEVKSVAISACGNFGFVGSSKGVIDMWNLQSGIKRGTFPKKQPAVKKKGQVGGAQGLKIKGHTSAVTSIVTDSTNRWITSVGLDGKIIFWQFMSGEVLHEIDWSASTAITAARLYRESDLLALSCDDLCIRVIDTETKKTVRELWGCGGRVNDFCFSNDGRWIIAASMDSIIRIWDLPTGHLIDGIKTRSVVTTVAWSGKGDFLVTGHVDDVGVNLWTNRTMFTRVPTRHLRDDEIIEINMPTSSGEGGTGVLESAMEAPGVDSIHTGTYTSKDQLNEKMLTLSLIPKSRWQTLLHLDLIRQRNKPQAAPTKPKSAPFFLGALSAQKDDNLGLISNTAGVDALAKDPAAEEAAALAEAEKSRVLRLQAAAGKLTNGSIDRPATRLLHESKSSSAAQIRFIEHFKTLSPASADLEIRSLDTMFWLEADFNDEKNTTPQNRIRLSLSDSSSLSSGAEGSEDEESETDELAAFINACTARLSTHRDWELVNTWMNVLMKVHGELLVQICAAAPPVGKNSTKGLSRKSKRAMAIRDALVKWRDEHARERKRVADLAGYCAGVVGFLRFGNR